MFETNVDILVETEFDPFELLINNKTIHRGAGHGAGHVGSTNTQKTNTSVSVRGTTTATTAPPLGSILDSKDDEDHQQEQEEGTGAALVIQDEFWNDSSFHLDCVENNNCGHHHHDYEEDEDYDDTSFLESLIQHDSTLSSLDMAMLRLCLTRTATTTTTKTTPANDQSTDEEEEEREASLPLQQPQDEKTTPRKDGHAFRTKNPSSSPQSVLLQLLPSSSPPLPPPLSPPPLTPLSSDSLSVSSYCYDDDYESESG